MWGNAICNGGDLIEEHSTKSGKERSRHVEQILNKYSDETRITFIKRKGSSKYQFIGVYKLDDDKTNNSLETNAPTCYWVRHLTYMMWSNISVYIEKRSHHGFSFLMDLKRSLVYICYICTMSRDVSTSCGRST